MRERAGLTLEQLAKKAGYAVATINGLELHGDGSQRLKEKLRDILDAQSLDTASVNAGHSQSVKRPVEINDGAREYKTVAECKQRINELERENERLRAMVMAAANPVSYRKRISSTLPAEDAGLLDDAESDDSGEPSKP